MHHFSSPQIWKPLGVRNCMCKTLPCRPGGPGRHKKKPRSSVTGGAVLSLWAQGVQMAVQGYISRGCIGNSSPGLNLLNINLLTLSTPYIDPLDTQKCAQKVGCVGTPLWSRLIEPSTPDTLSCWWHTTGQLIITAPLNSRLPTHFG